jgi:hypothetical protein
VTLSSVKWIEKGAFYQSSIESVAIGKSVEVIEDEAFYECMALKTVTFESESKLRTLGKGCFYNTAIETIEIPDQVLVIPEEAFSWCRNLKSFVAKNVKSIQQNAFSYGGLEGVEFPESLEDLEDFAFANCKGLQKISFAENPKLKKIGKRCFFRVGITEFSCPISVKVIGDEAFKGSEQLADFVLPDGFSFDFVGLNVLEGTVCDPDKQ